MKEVADVLDYLIALDTAPTSLEALNTGAVVKQLRSHLAAYPHTASTLLLVIAQAQGAFRDAVRAQNDARLYHALDFAIMLPRDSKHWTAAKHGNCCLKIAEALQLPMDATEGAHWHNTAVRIAREYAEGEGAKFGGAETWRRLTTKTTKKGPEVGHDNSPS